MRGNVDKQSTLETIAQVAVALGGFAGIVGALAGDKLRPTQPEVWLPFWALISSALGLVFVSLFPLLLDPFQFADSVVWAAASAFLFTLTAINLAFFLTRLLRASRAGVFRRIPTFQVPLDCACVLVLVTQALNAFGLGFSQSVGGFLVGLYLLLLVSSLNFAFLLYVIGWRPDDSAC
jgi:hypothetical protein